MLTKSCNPRWILPLECNSVWTRHLLVLTGHVWLGSIDWTAGVGILSETGMSPTSQIWWKLSWLTPIRDMGRNVHALIMLGMVSRSPLPLTSSPPDSIHPFHPHPPRLQQPGLIEPLGEISSFPGVSLLSVCLGIFKQPKVRLHGEAGEQRQLWALGWAAYMLE